MVYLFVWLYPKGLISHKRVALLQLVCCKFFLFAYCSAFRGCFNVLLFFKHREHLDLPLNTFHFLLHKTRQHSPFSKLPLKGQSQMLLAPNSCWWGACASLPVSRSIPDRQSSDSKIWIRKPMSLHQIASLQPRAKPSISVTILLRF